MCAKSKSLQSQTPYPYLDREAWRAAVHGVAKSQIRLSNWTELNYPYSLFWWLCLWCLKVWFVICYLFCSLVKVSYLLWFFLSIINTLILHQISSNGYIRSLLHSDSLVCYFWWFLLKAICFFIICFKGTLWGLVLRYSPLERISHGLCQASEGLDNSGSL